MNWQPIESAPTDGRWVFLKGGEIDHVGWEGTEYPPLVVARSIEVYAGPQDEPGWYQRRWHFAHFESDFYGEYAYPTHWAPIDPEDAKADVIANRRPDLAEMLKLIDNAKQQQLEPVQWMLSIEWTAEFRMQRADIVTILGLPFRTISYARYGALEVRATDGSRRMIECYGVPEMDDEPDPS